MNIKPEHIPYIVDDFLCHLRRYRGSDSYELVYNKETKMKDVVLKDGRVVADTFHLFMDLRQILREFDIDPKERPAIISCKGSNGNMPIFINKHADHYYGRQDDIYPVGRKLKFVDSEYEERLFPENTRFRVINLGEHSTIICFDPLPEFSP